MILFAVVIGVIEGLQYFTQAYVAALGRPARARRAAVRQRQDLGYPQDSTLFYPVLLYQQGFRYFNMGYASAMAMLLLVVAFAVTRADPAQLAALGPLPGAGADERPPAVAPPARSPRRRPPRRGAPRGGC